MLKKVSDYLRRCYVYCLSLCLMFFASLKHWMIVLQFLLANKYKTFSLWLSTILATYLSRLSPSITLTSKPQPRLFPQEDLNFIADSKLAVSGYESSHIRRILYAIALFFVVFLIWARFAMLDEITVGAGSVEPSSEVQVIQSLEGGIVSAI